jgi:hypothetical protein
VTTRASRTADDSRRAARFIPESHHRMSGTGMRFEVMDPVSSDDRGAIR